MVLPARYRTRYRIPCIRTFVGLRLSTDRRRHAPRRPRRDRGSVRGPHRTPPRPARAAARWAGAHSPQGRPRTHVPWGRRRRPESADLPGLQARDDHRDEADRPGVGRPRARPAPTARKGRSKARHGSWAGAAAWISHPPLSAASPYGRIRPPPDSPDGSPPATHTTPAGGGRGAPRAGPPVPHAAGDQGNPVGTPPAFPAGRSSWTTTRRPQGRHRPHVVRTRASGPRT